MSKEIASTTTLERQRVQEGSVIKLHRTVYVLIWEESERGWGVRPDGYSFHCTVEDASAYVHEYVAGLPVAVPDEYERLATPTIYTYEVDDEIYTSVKESKNGIRLYDRNTISDRKLFKPTPNTV